jgi:hypothetical protein
VPGQPGAIGPGAFDADLGHVAKCLEPGEQRLVASLVGGEALSAEQPTQRIQGGRHVDVSMGVDTTGHTPHSF